MTEQNQNLGKLLAVYPIAPAYLQRSLIVIILSFMFFMAMLIAFSIRQQIIYFVLSTAFLIVQLFTLFGFLTQRKQQVKIFENGLSYKKFSALWSEVESVETKGTGKISCTITKKGGEKITLSEAIYNLSEVIKIVTEKSVTSV